MICSHEGYTNYVKKRGLGYRHGAMREEWSMWETWNKGVKADMKDVQNGLETTGDSAAHIRQRQERF